MLSTKQAARTKNELQQTVLSHLKSPNQRSKARYMNIEILLKWAFDTLKIINMDAPSDVEEAKQRIKLEWLNNHLENLEKWEELLQVTMLSEHVVPCRKYYT